MPTLAAPRERVTERKDDEPAAPDGRSDYAGNAEADAKGTPSFWYFAIGVGVLAAAGFFLSCYSLSLHFPRKPRRESGSSQQREIENLKSEIGRLCSRLGTIERDIGKGPSGRTGNSWASSGAAEKDKQQPPDSGSGGEKLGQGSESLPPPGASNTRMSPTTKSDRDPFPSRKPAPTARTLTATDMAMSGASEGSTKDKKAATQTADKSTIGKLVPGPAYPTLPDKDPKPMLASETPKIDAPRVEKDQMAQIPLPLETSEPSRPYTAAPVARAVEQPDLSFHDKLLPDAWYRFTSEDEGRNKGNWERLEQVIRGRIQDALKSVSRHPSCPELAIVVVTQPNGSREIHGIPVSDSFRNVRSFFDTDSQGTFERIQKVCLTAKFNAEGAGDSMPPELVAKGKVSL